MFIVSCPNGCYNFYKNLELRVSNWADFIALVERVLWCITYLLHI